MKKYILMPLLAFTALSANAQDFDSKPTVTIDNKTEDLHFTVGARFMADAAYYHTDFTPMQSGAAITDARIRTSLTYQNWYFYADFGFGGGKFSQKNIFLQYAKDDNNGGRHAIKGGYYNDPAGSMARNTSLGSYHFISRAGAANALGEGRELGITYKYTNDHIFAYQGVFTENQYNKIDAGYNGLVLAGRYLYRPVIDENQTLAVGGNIRYQHVGGGVTENNVLKKTLKLGQTMETFVDEDEQFVSCELPWAENVLDAGVEALYHNQKMFASVVSICTSTLRRNATQRHSLMRATTTSTPGEHLMLGLQPILSAPTTSMEDISKQAIWSSAILTATTRTRVYFGG